MWGVSSLVADNALRDTCPEYFLKHAREVHSAPLCHSAASRCFQAIAKGRADKKAWNICPLKGIEQRGKHRCVLHMRDLVQAWAR